MRKVLAFLGAIAFAVLVSTTAQAASDTNLLEEITAGKATAVPMASAELDSVLGEGTFEYFLALPNLHRSFERNFEFNYQGESVSVSIVGEAGVGITLVVDSPLIP
jgi:hypothetical protein